MTSEVDPLEEIRRLRAALEAGTVSAAGSQPFGAPPPLPAVRDDPSVTAARRIQETYPAQVQAVRNDPDLNDIAKARRIGKIWRDACTELANLYADLERRRRARYDWLGQQLPVGPGIPPGTSPADKAVLMAAWNAALERARNATAAPGGNALARGLDALLAEAERFGDDVLRRAVITVCLDEGRIDLVKSWAERHAPEVNAQISEWQYLGQLLAGQHFDLRWQFGAFNQPRKPQEVQDLPRMVQTYNEAARAYNASAARGQGPLRPIIELDPEEL